MQVSYVGQYNKNASQPVGTPVPSTAVTSLTASLKELRPGSIFEGNVSYMKGSNVILSLENGQNVHARLDSQSLKLAQGQSMFFQVKSNENGTIAIRPYMGGGSANPTLMRALDAAGLPATERNLEMVNSMMKEQMPIHADALLDMHRVIVSNENINVNTLVQMTRLDLPITQEMAAQFENYQNDSRYLMDEMNNFMEELPQFLENQTGSAVQLLDMNTQILSILTDGMPETTGISGQAAAAVPDQLPPLNEEGTAVFDQLSPLTDGQEDVQGADPLVGSFISQTAGDEETEAYTFSPNQLGAVFTASQAEEFSDMVRSIGTLADNEKLFDEDGELNRNLTVRDTLAIIDQELQLHKHELELEDVRDLFSNRGYQRLLGQVMEEQWVLEPQDLKTKDKLSKMYDRLQSQMEQFERVLHDTGNDQSSLAKATGQVRSNVEFMNEVNQLYNFVQIPLKMNGQNANGDLYVYTNKRSSADKDGELTAFLHLDMEHLGSTDVYVKMKGKAVDTNFSFSDDKSYDLVQKYLPILDARLSALGYQATITVDGSREKKMDFVEDFLKKDLPGGGAGVVHRYSFDVRA
jgi:hypothetical protein